STRRPRRPVPERRVRMHARVPRAYTPPAFSRPPGASCGRGRPTHSVSHVSMSTGGMMPAEGSNIQKELNPLANAERQFDEAATRLNLPEGLKEVIKRPRRATIVSLPIQMDDGTLKVFTGYRVQHSIVRGPAKGGIRYHPQ